MKGKASDICTKCKHCEGLDMFAKMYSCKHYNNYPDAAIGMDSEIDCCNFEEVTMNKVKGKVSDWCPKCKNCKGTTNEYDGNDFVVITGVECEDPYDGMTKTLDAESDICCSMFEPKSDQKRCCENIYFMPSQVNAMIDDVKRQKDIERNAAVNGLRVQIKQLEIGYEELNIENEQRKKAMDNQFKMIQDLQKERDDLAEKLKNSDISKVPKLEAQIKNLKYLNEESYKREKELEAKITSKNNDIDTLLNENTSLNTINKGLAEDRKKLINYIRSLKIASENYLKEFTYEED